MCKRLNFDYTTKWYKHKSGSVQENEMQNILWDFKILTDYLIPDRRLDLELIGKKKKRKEHWHHVNFAASMDYKVKIKEREKINKYKDLARELKQKFLEHAGDSDTNYSWCTWNSPQRTGKKLKELEISRRIKTIQITALLRLASTLRKVLESWGDFLTVKLQWKITS